MGINGITAGYYPTGYETGKTGKAAPKNNFAKEIAGKAQASGAGAAAALHCSDEETGDIAVSSWADVVNGSSTTVYKTKDFDPENPVYKVKTWMRQGT